MKKAVILLCFTLIVGSLYAQKVQNGVLTIPAGTTEIKGGAYYGMTDIEKVVIPSSAPQSAPKGGMVYVEGGSFTMGDNNGREYEKPAHRVTVSSFYLCDHEVTQDEYVSVVGGFPYRMGHRGLSLPVEKTSWYDAVFYCNRRSVKEGLTPCYAFKGEKDPAKWGEDFTKFYSYDPYPHWELTCDWTADGYRLPTEAEWEWAARGGKQSRGYKYSGSNNLDEVAWYAGTSRVDDEVTSYGAEIFHNEPREVKTKKPNELGLYDMSGNYYEWCWDWYKGYGEKTSTKLYRIIRGGGFAMEASVYTLDEAASYCTVAHRQRNTPNSSSLEDDPGMGIRLVRTAK